MPVIIDDKPSGNLPRHQDEVDRDKALQRYCKFDEAHRVLLSFCTYTGLSGGVGKTRVQFPIYRDDFTSPKNFWYQKFFQYGHGGAIIDVEIEGIVDIRVEVIKKKGKQGTYLDTDLNLLL